MKIVVRCRQTGYIIEYVSSTEEGLNLIREFEEKDKEEGIYEEDFYEVAEIERTLRKNKLVALICQSYVDMVKGCSSHNDYYSLEDALRIVKELGENISRIDIIGRLNPHLDIIAENWDEYEA